MIDADPLRKQTTRRPDIVVGRYQDSIADPLKQNIVILSND
jgi:hypothetical protein